MCGLPGYTNSAGYKLDLSTGGETKKATLHQKLKRAQPQKKCIPFLKVEMYTGQLI